jgi:hypothetical protein
MKLSEFGAHFAKNLGYALKDYEVRVIKVTIEKISLEGTPSSEKISFHFDARSYAEALKDAINQKYNINLNVHKHPSRDEKFALVYSRSLTEMDTLFEAYQKDSRGFDASIQQIAQTTKKTIDSPFRSQPVAYNNQRSLLSDIFQPSGKNVTTSGAALGIDTKAVVQEPARKLGAPC